MSDLPEPRPKGHRRFTLSEKIAIVREASIPGISTTHVARRHGVAVNVLYYWRKAYADVAQTDLAAAEAGSATDRELADLRLQVRNLERLLGKRTLEIALLREQLGRDEDEDEAA